MFQINEFFDDFYIIFQVRWRPNPFPRFVTCRRGGTPNSRRPLPLGTPTKVQILAIFKPPTSTAKRRRSCPGRPARPLRGLLSGLRVVLIPPWSSPSSLIQQQYEQRGRRLGQRSQPKSKLFSQQQQQLCSLRWFPFSVQFWLHLWIFVDHLLWQLRIELCTRCSNKF